MISIKEGIIKKVIKETHSIEVLAEDGSIYVTRYVFDSMQKYVQMRTQNKKGKEIGVQHPIYGYQFQIPTPGEHVVILVDEDTNKAYLLQRTIATYENFDKQQNLIAFKKFLPENKGIKESKAGSSFSNIIPDYGDKYGFFYTYSYIIKSSGDMSFRIFNYPMLEHLNALDIKTSEEFHKEMEDYSSELFSPLRIEYIQSVPLIIPVLKMKLPQLAIKLLNTEMNVQYDLKERSTSFVFNYYDRPLGKEVTTNLLTTFGEPSQKLQMTWSYNKKVGQETPEWAVSSGLALGPFSFNYNIFRNLIYMDENQMTLTSSPRDPEDPKDIPEKGLPITKFSMNPELIEIGNYKNKDSIVKTIYNQDGIFIYSNQDGEIKIMVENSQEQSNASNLRIDSDLNLTQSTEETERSFISIKRNQIELKSGKHSILVTNEGIKFSTDEPLTYASKKGVSLEAGEDVVIKGKEVYITGNKISIKGDFLIDGNFDITGNLKRNGDNVITKTEFEEYKTKMEQILTTLKTSLNAHTHVSTGPGAPTTPMTPPLS